MPIGPNPPGGISLTGKRRGSRVRALLRLRAYRRAVRDLDAREHIAWAHGLLEVVTPDQYRAMRADEVSP